MTPAAQRRVALIPSAYHPETGGVEEHTRQVARALVARGQAVEIWTVRRDRSQPARDVVDGIPVRRLPCPLPAMRTGNILRFLLELPMARRAWLEALREFQPDVLHVHCFGPNGLYAQWLGRHSRLPIVFSAHGETVADNDDVFTHSGLLRIGLRRMLRRADVVTGCSAFTLTDLRQRFGLAPNAGVVVFNGVDMEVAEAELPSASRPYLFAVGRAVHNKGFDLLIQAFERTPSASDLDLVIGGDGPYRADLERIASRGVRPERVRFLGWVSPGEVSQLMRGARAVAVPSRVEPFGIVILEAWRAGAPVLATNRGGPPEFVRDGADGVLVDPTDLDALVAGLEHLLADPERGRAMGEAGRSRLPDFRWEQAAAAYLRCYDQAGARRRHQRRTASVVLTQR